MPQSRHWFTTAPYVIVLSALLGASGVIAFLAYPQVVMRTALINHPAVESPDAVRVASGDARVAYKVLTGTADEGANSAPAVRPLGWVGPLHVGDRITIAQPQGGLRTLEVIAARPLISPLEKVSNDSDIGALTLIISKVVGAPEAAKVRFIIETAPGQPFDDARETAAHSL